jgi:hypothetical protein
LSERRARDKEIERVREKVQRVLSQRRVREASESEGLEDEGSKRRRGGGRGGAP